jgi:hypothetical protein
VECWWVARVCTETPARACRKRRLRLGLGLRLGIAVEARAVEIGDRTERLALDHLTLATALPGVRHRARVNATALWMQVDVEVKPAFE